MDEQLRNIKPVAIVGMASHFPDANSLFDFWNNIGNQKDSVTDNLGLDGYWKKEDFYEQGSKDKDKTYAHKAGWIPPIDFNPLEFKLPPNMVESISTAQLFALYVAKKALLDARMIGDNPIPVNKQKVGVILGGAGNGNTSFVLAARQQAPFVKNILLNSGLPDYLVDDVIARLLDQYQEWNEDSFPGFLGNVACGRISSCFDFGGTSNMVDAACASSLAAMKAAVSELDSYSCDAVVTGGVNLENSIFSFLCFSRTPALSPSNISRPFDQKSDGMMLGDGVGILVLKRLDDAIASGDKIYAVIKGLSGSSDGKAKSIFAPRKEGQILALNRAYQEAEIQPSDIQLVEAHGTGTAAGDHTEIKSLEQVYSQDDQVKPKSIALGSVKSQIGHTRCAAGAASMIKAALALHHKVYPATINVETPNKQLQDPSLPFYINTYNRPWILKPEQRVRRAAVSAFGFGGTNYHAVLEEYEAEQSKPYRLTSCPVVFAFSAPDRMHVVAQCSEFLDLLSAEGAEQHFYAEIERQKSADEILAEHARLTFAAADVDEAIKYLSTALDVFKRNAEASWDHPQGIFFRDQNTIVKKREDVVLLFPGQGSQYVNMGLELSNEFPQMRDAFDLSNKVRNELDMSPISEYVFPNPVFNDQDRESQEQSLRQTQHTQPAIGTVSLGMLSLLRTMGLSEQFYAGHSYGELTALYAAGRLEKEDFLKLSVKRGQLMGSVKQGEEDEDRGSMIAVAMSESAIQAYLDGKSDLWVANVNGPDQVVLGGGSTAVLALKNALQKDNVKCSVLPVSAAFHTPFVAHASDAFRAAVSDISVQEGSGRVYANVNGCAYDRTVDSVRENLTLQLSSSVKFTQMIEQIYADGGRYFIEIGPKGALSTLVSSILKGKPISTVSLNPSNKGSDSVHFRRALAKLAADGVVRKFADPYQLFPQPQASKSGISIHINGGYYSSPASLERQKRGKRKDSSLIERFIKENVGDFAAPSKETSQEVEESLSSWQPITSSANERDAVIVETASVTSIEKDSLTDFLAPTVSVDENDIFNFETQEHIMSKGNQQPSSQHTDKLSTLSAHIQSQSLSNQVHQQFQSNQTEYIKFLNAMMTQQAQLFDKHASSPDFANMLDSFNKSLSLMEVNQHCYHANHGKYFTNQQDMLGRTLDGTQGKEYTVLANLPELSEAPNYQSANGVNGSARSFNSNANGVNGSQEHTNGHLAANGQNENDLVKHINGATAINGQDGLAIQPVKTELPQVNQSHVETDSSVVPQSSPLGQKKSQSQAEIDALAQLKLVTRESLTNDLVKIISEKTGYPEDMIGIDMDLEGDLGIDSIKRIEIIGAMFESFETDLQMQDDAEDYSDLDSFDVEEFSTIEKMVSFLANQIQEFIEHLEQGGTLEELDQKFKDDSDSSKEHAPHSGTSGPEISARCEVAESADDVDENVVSVMQSIGFVSSSKDLANAGDARPKPEPTEKESSETPSSVGDKLSDFQDAANAPKLVVDNDVQEVPVQRFEVIEKTLPSPDTQEVTLPKGTGWLVIDEGHNAAGQLVQQLNSANAPVAVITYASDRAKKLADVAHFSFEDASEQNVSVTLKAAEEALGRVGGVIILQRSPDKYASISEQLNTADRKRLIATFMVAKYLSASLRTLDPTQGRGHFLVATQMDGRLGFQGKQGFSLYAAGITGLVKSLSFEWPNIQCRVVDLKPRLTAKKAVTALMEELTDIDRSVIEVARGDGCLRTTLALESTSSAKRNELNISKSDVFVVTGGARGITAECVIRLSKHVNTHFILLGRTDIDAPLPEWAQNKGLKDLRRAALEFLSQQGEQATPVKVNKMVDQVTRVVEVQETLKRIEEGGSRATYVNADITDTAKAVDALVNVQEQFGQITGIIHGAGNLADKKIEKKTLEDFELVVDTKIQGLLNALSVVTPSALKHICVFSSVSGFFGNAGQTDYSIANEILSKLVHTCSRFLPNVQAKSICWGPWDSGMVNETLKKAYADRNIAIIPLEQGTEKFVEEFSYDTLQVVIGSEKYHTGRLPKMSETGLNYDRQLMADQAVVLADHSIDGAQVLPATFAMQWIMQSAQYVVPHASVTGLADFQVLKGITFEDATAPCHCSVETSINAVNAGDKSCAVEVRISSHRDDKVIYHYEGTVTLKVAALPEEQRNVTPLQLTSDWQLQDLNGRAVYTLNDQPGWLFHGTRLQGIYAVDELSEQRACAAIHLAQPESWPSSPFANGNFNPCLADAVLQVPYLWSVTQTDKLGLPSGVASATYFSPLMFDTDYDVRATIQSSVASKLVVNIEVSDRNKGKVVMLMEGVQFTQSKALREKLLAE